MKPGIREEIEPLARELFDKKWRPDERTAIKEEFFLTDDEADGVVEILRELKKEKTKK